MDTQNYKDLLLKIIENETALCKAIASRDKNNILDLIVQYKMIRDEVCKKHRR